MQCGSLYHWQYVILALKCFFGSNQIPQFFRNGFDLVLSKYHTFMYWCTVGSITESIWESLWLIIDINAWMCDSSNAYNRYPDYKISLKKKLIKISPYGQESGIAIRKHQSYYFFWYKNIKISCSLLFHVNTPSTVSGNADLVAGYSISWRHLF